MRARCIEHLWIPLADGCRLGARLWLPEQSDGKSFPGILEYIPYRKDDYTAIRDSTTIAWFASQGYACLRVDMRGSGSSDGVLYDEYSEQETRDGVAVIEWMAEQSWCDGNVGTIGISWGGITGLQIAQRQPEALKTVIALGATEFRYYDDGSYYMGCMTGQTIGWAAIMFGYNSRPPDPALVGDRWRDLWLERLHSTPHFLEHFLSHQREDAYWLHGTVGKDYGAVSVPVFAISGHADCWPNTVSRLLENLNVVRQGLQGAWCHRYPHLGIPGPTVDFLSAARRWFDHWLKGIDDGLLQEPVYQFFLQDSVEPAAFYKERPGCWLAEYDWPSDRIQNQEFGLTTDGVLLPHDPAVEHHGPTEPRICDDTEHSSKSELIIDSPQTVGLDGGEYMPWFAFGEADELPGDQQLEDLNSLVFDTSPLPEPLSIVGNVRFRARVQCSSATGLLAVRLCDVWPDGKSTLITRGILNLCQRNGKDNPGALQRGRWYDVEVVLNHTAYRLKVGNRLRLACSNCYWPIAWPSNSKTKLTVDPAHSKLHLPIHINIEQSSADVGVLLSQGSAPVLPEPLKTVQIRPFKQSRTRTVDQKTGKHILQIDSDNGQIRYENNGISMSSRNLQRYSIHPQKPLSAMAEYEWEWEFSRSTEWVTKTYTRTCMTSDAAYFHVSTVLTAWENGEEVFSRHSNKSWPRDFF